MKWHMTYERHRLTGGEQYITNIYRLETNGLAERQNKMIGNSLIKVLNENAAYWPYTIDD